MPEIRLAQSHSHRCYRRFRRAMLLAFCPRYHWEVKYWLMKSEPDTYSIDDLAAKSPAMWEGCRNYTVRIFFRDQMSIGDMAFFYNSNSDPSGIAGTMKI